MSTSPGADAPLNRPSLLANLDSVLAHLRKTAPARAAGQGGLFDAVPEQAPLAMVYTRVDDWHQDTKLWHERRVLGAFVSGHPVVSRRAKLKRFTHLCRDRYRIETTTSAWDRVVVVGLIRRFEPKGRIGFITIEDETGALDLIVFSDEMAQYAHALVENMIVAVRLKVRHDNDRMGLQLLECARLDQFRDRG